MNVILDLLLVVNRIIEKLTALGYGAYIKGDPDFSKHQLVKQPKPLTERGSFLSILICRLFVLNGALCEL